MLINDRVAIKIIEIDSNGGNDVVFDVEYLCYGWVEKDRVNVNLVKYD